MPPRRDSRTSSPRSAPCISSGASRDASRRASRIARAFFLHERDEILPSSARRNPSDSRHLSASYRRRLVTDRDTGKLKGYGFAEFMDLATAQSAKRNLNGRDYNGRALRVEFQDGEDGAPPAKKPDRGAPPATAVGYDAPLGAAHTAGAAAQIAASGVAAGSGLDAITARIAEMSPAQLFNVFNQLKAQIQVRSMHWSPYDRVRVVNAVS